MSDFSPKVLFFQIIKPMQKILRIVKTAEFHLKEKIPLCILAPNEEALKFVDNALWKEPLLSFIPHSIDSNTETIFITQKKENIHPATHLFNLCSTPLLQDSLFITYEFEDSTSPDKKALSDAKFKAYKDKGYIIELQQ